MPAKKLDKQHNKEHKVAMKPERVISLAILAVLTWTVPHVVGQTTTFSSPVTIEAGDTTSNPAFGNYLTPTNLGVGGACAGSGPCRGDGRIHLKTGLLHINASATYGILANGQQNMYQNHLYIPFEKHTIKTGSGTL